MKSQLISAMGSFVLGGSVALVGLASWTGTSELNSIKEYFNLYEQYAEEDVSQVVSHYAVTVDEANAEIGEYKQALAQANSNISQLITAYETKVEEMEQAQASAEQDLADLQMELASMEDRLNAQYEADMNAIIEQANAEINKANQEVSDTAADVFNTFIGSDAVNKEGEDYITETGKVLDTEGDKTVTDISGIVGEVVEGE